ncbi:mechanosensitive ion channel family protein [Coleofasciculus sp. E2-BRE-01]|uniref:mechanosensitive ion channel family protein n=1 Tax=Coleofasciculus sp. E2-BRE-01 TaxID=3069524 RepID=UPI0032F37E23
MKFVSFVRVRIVRTLVVAFMVGCLLAVLPSLAQNTFNPTNSIQTNSVAPIMLDGRKIFEVTPSEQYSAQERAEYVNQVLQELVETAESPISVELTSKDKIPVIEIDGQHLVSVTSDDTPEGRSPQEQAEFWQKKLQTVIQKAQYERTPIYLIQATLLSMGCVLLAIALSWLLGKLWSDWLKPQLDKEAAESAPLEGTKQANSPKFAGQVLLTLIRCAIWVYALIYITTQFRQTRELSRIVTDTIIASLTSDMIPLGDNSYSVLNLLILISLFVGLIILAKVIKQGLRSRILRFTGLSRAAQETIAIIFNYAFIFISSLVLLQLWGLDISSLTVFAGVLGVGIGLGLQGIAKEFISGLVLIFERPIQVGDFVDVGGLMGTVEYISVRSTEIKTLDDISIIIPNSRFLESEVINWSHHSAVSRLKIPVGVAYGSNLKTVRSALIDAAKEHSDVLPQPIPRVFFKGFGDSSLDFDLLVWISEPRKQFQIKSDLYFRIEVILRHRDVEIPFPQRDLHVRSGNLPIDISPQLVESLAQLSQSLAKWLDQQSTVSPPPDGNGHGKH